MAVETRRTTLVDLSLDLIQRLIAHAHLAGPVHSISHKRDPAAARSGRKVGARRASLVASLQQAGCKEEWLSRGSHCEGLECTTTCTQTSQPRVIYGVVVSC